MAPYSFPSALGPLAHCVMVLMWFYNCALKANGFCWSTWEFCSQKTILPSSSPTGWHGFLMVLDSALLFGICCMLYDPYTVLQAIGLCVLWYQPFVSYWALMTSVCYQPYVTFRTLLALIRCPSVTTQVVQANLTPHIHSVLRDSTAKPMLTKPYSKPRTKGQPVPSARRSMLLTALTLLGSTVAGAQAFQLKSDMAFRKQL